MKKMLEEFKQIYSQLSPFFDEKLKRLFLGSFAATLGHGGILAVARVAEVDRQTVAAGKNELLGSGTEKPPVPRERGRTRREGGGRKKAVETDARLRADIDSLISPLTRGDPESPLRWTCKSSRKLAGELCGMGHKISHVTVSKVLHEMGYSLQGNSKVLEGASQHTDRNEQFEHINAHAELFQAGRQPVISVDTKKKELVGLFKNGGKELCPKGEPEKVNVHDFPDEELGRASPYGVYDLALNAAWVNVGIDNDTSEFAVESIRRWWLNMGSESYPDAKLLYITADSGGSNGYRVRLWKQSLQAFANETGLTVHVSHFPPGTSKWNKIEHRLFSFISQNWRGKPLISYEVIVNLIGATTTKNGLVVGCGLDENVYPKGKKVSDEEM
jgi:hypothetical protein